MTVKIRPSLMMRKKKRLKTARSSDGNKILVQNLAMMEEICPNFLRGQDGSLLDILKPLLQVGKLLHLCTFSVKTNTAAGIDITTSKLARILGRTSKTLLSAYTILLVATEKDSNQRITLMDILWRCNFLLFGLYTLTVRWCLESHWSDWAQLFRQSADIHVYFGKLGVPLKLSKITKVLRVGAALLPLAVAAHICVVRRMYRPGIESKLQHPPWNLSPDSTLLDVLGPVTLMLDYLVWAAQYFGDWLWLYIGIYTWSLLKTLICQLSKEECQRSRELEVHEVITAHMKITGFLATANKLLGVITFFSCTHTILYCSYYLNYALIEDKAIPERLLVFVFFIIRHLLIYFVCMDVSAKAHSVTDWLESRCRSNQIDLPPRELPTLLVFSAQVYSGDAIGFKGMQFFTINSSFVAAVLSIIATYTLVITQFALSGNMEARLARLCGGSLWNATTDAVAKPDNSTTSSHTTVAP